MKKNYLILVSILIVFFTVIICLSFGSANISCKEVYNILLLKIFNTTSNALDSTFARIVLDIRLPRLLLAFVTGGILAICGCVYQSIFNNPLADPYLLGTSSGASFGATIAIGFGFTGSLFFFSYSSLFAFLGAIFSVLIVFLLSKKSNYSKTTSLLLSGVVVSYILTALISLIMLLNSNKMKEIMFWTLGSFSSKTWNHFYVVLIALIILIGIISFYLKDMDILLLGEEKAVMLGVNVKKERVILLSLTSFASAIAVSISGIIGFIGLIATHIARMLLGPTHYKMMPLAFLIGGELLLICDTVARSLILSEIPVGIITSLIGAPFFLFILLNKRRIS